MDLMKAGANRFIQINELDEMRLDAYESSISYKERTKKWHDKRIKAPTNYERNDKALLFNSHVRLFPEKLKSRWYGPFSVSKHMQNGAIELYDEDGNEFIVNKQWVKPYQKNVLDTNRDDDITLDDEGEVTFLALGWHLEETHMTWAHLEKKCTRLRLYTKYLEEPRIQSVEMASPQVRRSSLGKIEVFFESSSFPGYNHTGGDIQAKGGGGVVLLVEIQFIDFNMLINTISLLIKDTANSEGKKETKAMVFHKIDTEEICDRFVAPCFVNELEAYDGEINIGVEENMISNEFAVKLCLDHEVKMEIKVNLLHLATLIFDPGERLLGPEHPPSPDYVPGPEHPPSPVEVPYVPEPEYPEYLVPSDAEAPLEDQPLPVDASPTALSLGYGWDDDDPFDDDDDDTDDEDEEPFEDEDDNEEEEEHLALADSSAIPIVDPVPSAGDTKAFETDKSAPTPRSPQTKVHFAQTRLCRARKTVRLEPPMSPSMEACIAEYVAAPTPSSPLPPPQSSLHLPPQLTAAPRPIGGHRIDYGFIGTTDAEIRRRRAEEVSYGIRDVWVDPTKAVEEVAPTTLKGVNARVTELAAV
ncbi:hypothetical protein Tco_0705405, partial [Tanacetum coccineum]